MLYASVGPVLSWYAIDADAATLTRRGSLELPVNVQYAWPDAARRHLYVASSNGGPLRLIGDTHHLAALRIDPATGALEPHGAPQALRQRPLHVSLDRSGRFLLTAYNLPSAVTVHRVLPDGSVGPEVPQADGLDVGICAHQVVTTPSNRFAILPTRGEYPEVDSPEEPGALKLFRFEDGRLSNAEGYAPNGGYGYGYGYGPRHIGFHPRTDKAYLVVERQNRLQTFRLDDDKGLAGPLFDTTTLVRPDRVVGRQMAGAVHLHPNGRFVYVSNRSLGDGGEDNIAVFALDPETGEPTLIQNQEVGSIHARTFSIDGTGRVLVAATTRSHAIPRDGRMVEVPATLSVFRIGPDGRLSPAHAYEVDTGSHEQFWSGIV